MDNGHLLSCLLHIDWVRFILKLRRIVSMNTAKTLSRVSCLLLHWTFFLIYSVNQVFWPCKTIITTRSVLHVCKWRFIETCTYHQCVSVCFLECLVLFISVIPSFPFSTYMAPMYRVCQSFDCFTLLTKWKYTSKLVKKFKLHRCNLWGRLIWLKLRRCLRNIYLTILIAFQAEKPPKLRAWSDIHTIVLNMNSLGQFWEAWFKDIHTIYILWWILLVLKDDNCLWPLIAISVKCCLLLIVPWEFILG